MYEVISDIYEAKVGKIEMLWWKVKDKYQEDRKNVSLTYEALASIILKEYQKLKVWYTVYGCEHQDLTDLVYGHHILNALDNPEEFPVIKLSSVSAAMLGISDQVEPSDMYDIFAHYADKLQPQESDNHDEPIFTPDIVQYEAVVSRFKWYSDIKAVKTNKKYVTLISEVNAMLLETCNVADKVRLVQEALSTKDDYYKMCLYEGIASIITNEYLERYSSPPYSFPLSSDNLIITVENENLRVQFNIKGIKAGETVWETVYDKRRSIPLTAEEIMSFVLHMVKDIKKELAGLEKERNRDSAAYEGKYPRKNHSSHGLKLKNIPLHLAEKQALFVIKKALRYSNSPSLSSSFGRDSTITLHLMRRVTKTGFKIVFNNTRCEYAETIEFKKKLTKLWNLEQQLITTYPKGKTTFWTFIDEYGWNFERKGNRRTVNGHDDKTSRSEICCKDLKHEPMNRAMAKYKFDSNFTGLRAYESRSRDLAGKRDGLLYFAKEWGCLRINPILFFTDEMVDEYEKKYDVPYSEIYDMVLLDENGKVIYQPRTGCQGCMVTAAFGYLRWLKKYKPKFYRYIMKDRGLAETLYRMSLGLEPIKKQGDYIEVNFLDTPVSEVNSFEYENSIAWEDLEYLLETRPCMFEKAIQ